jgi:cyclic pyranopterin phosphate synthase
MKQSKNLSHFNNDGEAHLVDVSNKNTTARIAIAIGSISMAKASLNIIKTGVTKKGDVLSISRIAGIMGAKKTSELVPLCHPLPLTNVSVDLKINEKLLCIDISVKVKTLAQTGVEMEALTGVAVTALTIYDMVKSIDKGMTIGDIKLKLKDGGKSGRFEV